MPPETAIEIHLRECAQFDRQLATAANGAFSPSGLMTNFARSAWNYWMQYADCHCWQCDGEITMDDWRAEKCPHCQRDLIPF
jgi:hypothetical protein